MTDIDFDFLKSKTITREMASLFCGRKIGSGAGRDVYNYRLDKDLVIKIEQGACSFQNVIEWKVWEEVKDTPFAKYFAPCLDISDCGGILIQKKVEIAYRKDYPKKIPAFLTDNKYQNFGMLDGKFVCFDYGTYILTSGMTKKMKKADWWE